MEKKIKEMAKNIANTEKAHISLDEALREGWVIPKQDVEKIVQQEIIKHEKIIRQDIEKEISNKYANVKKEIRDREVESYLRGTPITCNEFGRRLIKMNIKKEYVQKTTGLCDAHFKLNDKDLWAFIRSNYKQS